MAWDTMFNGPEIIIIYLGRSIDNHVKRRKNLRLMSEKDRFHKFKNLNAKFNNILPQTRRKYIDPF